MRIFLSLFFLFSFFSTKSQTLRFQQTIGDKDAEAHSVLKTTEGGYVLAGKSWNYQNTDYDIFLLKLDSLGNVIWKKTYGDTLVYEWETDLKKAQDGGFVMTGQSFSLTTFLSNSFILKTDSLGNIIWHKSFGGSLKKVVVDNNGYLVAGDISTLGMGNNDLYLLKTDLNGNVLWSKSKGEFFEEDLSYVDQYKDGWLLAGQSNSNSISNVNNYFIYTDSLGNTIKEYAIGDTTEESVIDVTKRTSGGLVITGHINVFDSLGKKHRMISLYKVDDTFHIVWQKMISCGYHTDVQKIILTKPDEGIAICGTKFDTDSSLSDGFLIKVDSNGQILWSKSYGGSNDEAFYDLVQMSDTGFAIVGMSRSFNIFFYNNIYLVKTDQQGSSFCHDSSTFLSEMPTYFTQHSVHTSTDTGTVFASNIFYTDTLGIVKTICSTYSPVKIDEVNQQSDFKLYPNPSSGIINIDVPKNCTITIFNVAGSVIFSKKLVEGKNAISEFHLAEGFYIYEAISQENSILSRGKFVVE